MTSTALGGTFQRRFAREAVGTTCIHIPVYRQVITVDCEDTPDPVLQFVVHKVLYVCVCVCL